MPLALSVFALILAATYFYTRVFSARGALLHVGAFIGTIMAVNVFAIIIPNQKKMVAQLLRGEAPDARYGADRQAALDPQQLSDAARAADDGVAALSVPVDAIRSRG